MRYGEEVVNYRKKGENGGPATTTPLGTCQFKIYETVDEAVQDLGETKLLSVLNTQVKTFAMNDYRDANRPGGETKTAIKNRIIASIPSEEWTRVITEYLQAGKTPQQAIDDLVAERLEAMSTEGE